MEKTIEIPEGYEARVEGNKVILEKKKNKEAWIPKEILKYLIQKGDYRTCWATWLEKQKEQKPIMIQWTGKNLKEVIDFTGKSQKFSEWFKSWKDFENYVHTHDDIIKLFCEDGSHYEVPVGAWIVKTPDGYNIPSRFRFIKKPAEWNEEDEWIRKHIIKILENLAPCHWDGNEKARCIAYLERQQPVQDKEEREYVRTLKSLIADFLRDKEDVNRGYYQDIYDWLDGRHIEQKPAEWNEEDEHNLNSVISLVHSTSDGAWGSCVGDRIENWLKSLPERFNLQPGSRPNANHTIWHNASEEKPTKLPIIHIWYHGNRVNAVVAHENIGLQAELDDINFQPDDKWAYVEDLLNVQPHWKPSEEQIDELLAAIEVLKSQGEDISILDSLYHDLKKL